MAFRSCLAVFVLVTAVIAVTAVVAVPASMTNWSAEPELATTQAAEQTEPETFNAIVIFRNDDLQPDYRVKELQAVDQVFVEEEVPVTQGVVPVSGGTPVDEHDAFCEYVREMNADHPELFEFSMHGYTHERNTAFFGASEFGNVPADTQAEWVREGAVIMENCTGDRPTTFVAPFNTYDDNTVDAVEAEEFVAVSGNTWFTGHHYDETGVFETGDVVHVPSDQSFVDDWSNGTFRDQSELEASFDAAYENQSVYVQMLHYTTFTTDDRLDQLRAFIRYAKSHDVKFMTVGEFAAAREDGRLVEHEDGWTYYPDGSNVEDHDD